MNDESLTTITGIAALAGLALGTLVLIAIVLVPAYLGRIRNEIIATRTQQAKQLALVVQHLYEIKSLTKANYEREEIKHASENAGPDDAGGADTFVAYSDPPPS